MFRDHGICHFRAIHALPYWVILLVHLLNVKLIEKFIKILEHDNYNQVVPIN